METLAAPPLISFHHVLRSPGVGAAAKPQTMRRNSNTLFETAGTL